MGLIGRGIRLAHAGGRPALAGSTHLAALENLLFAYAGIGFPTLANIIGWRAQVASVDYTDHVRI